MGLDSRRTSDQTLLKKDGIVSSDTPGLPLHPEKTKKCSWLLVFQANRPRVYYHQLIDSASNVTRSLQNHQLLCMEAVTYKLETAEPKPAAQLCFQWETGGHRSHGLALGPTIPQKTHTTKNSTVSFK